MSTAKPNVWKQIRADLKAMLADRLLYWAALLYEDIQDKRSVVALLTYFAGIRRLERERARKTR